MNPLRLRPYHNPEKVDESRVPAGWRFLYKGEIRKRLVVKLWFPEDYKAKDGWVEEYHWACLDSRFTYITPVA